MATQYPPRISLVPGSIQEFIAGDIYILQEYVQGDFNGNSLNHTVIKSDASGSFSTLDLSVVGDLIVNYLDCQDIHVINGTITSVGGTDNGGNNGITFSAAQPNPVGNLGTILSIQDGAIVYVDSLNKLIINKLWMTSQTLIDSDVSA